MQTAPSAASRKLRALTFDCPINHRTYKTGSYRKALGTETGFDQYSYDCGQSPSSLRVREEDSDHMGLEGTLKHPEKDGRDGFWAGQERLLSAVGPLCSRGCCISARNVAGWPHDACSRWCSSRVACGSSCWDRATERLRREDQVVGSGSAL